MTRQTAIKLNVEVTADHTVRLPDDVPIGPAELIVFVAENQNGSVAVSPIGLFESDPGVVDQVMGYVREMRSSSRMRALPE